MRLVGMLDSPYVRRTAISLRLLGLPFTHESVSVFREFERFHAINPVVKAPSLVCDNGVVLMDSTLIIDYAESLAGRSLMPAQTASRQAALRIVGLALAASEKVVQNFYEHSQRPAGKLHQPWLDRVDAQRESAFALLEAELATRPVPAGEAETGQAELTAAVTWTFSQFMMPGAVDPARHPALVALTAALERLPAFEALPCA
ncbi:Glutathione S-transferase [Cupriavidus necator]|uniref:Glutathione S-transferase n=1 Tax=Cupriavidus necator (strain ATCC 17699 / DSM 428 / KCTC 22496 / NCIMB 10442 / H16 / Stanier 337) TaxID=381666 RepID=Q0K3V5_CUPNH|nr:glutathione S-transferase family protein [Cupriavidus necator]QCC03231.1 glutathione S-transferase family protein [Cupriavidus necator H16]QQB80288.1 glutathione S-transferase family protein [Cupriavidus necator]WKA44559.1 glutathione S-transferase family protein [Cupriavidus necator]CAJ95319.1 Glutathione S-transferase [Cupriavidus necator H16]